MVKGDFEFLFVALLCFWEFKYAEEYLCAIYNPYFNLSLLDDVILIICCLAEMYVVLVCFLYVCVYFPKKFLHLLYKFLALVAKSSNTH